MTPVVAIVALSLAATRAPLALTVLQERVRLPVAAVRATSSPFERSVVVELPRGVAPAPVALRLKFASRICPDVEAGPASLVFRCSTEKLRVSISHTGGVSVLDLTQLSVPPWRPGEEGPPLAVFDPVALGFEATSHEARGEAALASGDAAEARRHFEAALKAGPSPFAELRLGDLALAGDEPDAAVARWLKARSEAPWSRLAAMRLCELEPHCIGGPSEDSVFDPKVTPIRLRADVTLRRLRLQALRGEVVAAAAETTIESRVDGACTANPRWCRHLLEVALHLPPPDGAGALGVYLETPGRLEGPDALPLARAAAAQAKASGAPRWAANLLAAMTGRVPAAEQGAHLLEVALLYLEGGDLVRGDEIHRFARTRLSKTELASPGWATVARALKGAGKAGRSEPTPAAGTGADADLAAARGALDAARLASIRKGTDR